MRLSGSVLVNCSRLNSGMQLWEPVSLGRPVLKDQAQQQAGQETSQKTWKVMRLQVKGDLEKKELQDRVTELSALLVQSQKQNEEKEKTVKTLNDTVEILEASLLEKEYEASLTKSVKEENLSLQKLIKDITEQAESGNILSCLSSADAERAFVLVQEALARRRGATQALEEELSARQDSVSFLLHQHRQQEEKCRKLQQSLEQLEQECQTASSHQQHLQSLVEALRRLSWRLRATLEYKTPSSQHATPLNSVLWGPFPSYCFSVNEGKRLPAFLCPSPIVSLGVHGLPPARVSSQRSEQLCQESSHRGHALATVSKEKEFLEHEKAALEVRLAALQQDRRGLSEQLAEARNRAKAGRHHHCRHRRSPPRSRQLGHLLSRSWLSFLTRPCTSFLRVTVLMAPLGEGVKTILALQGARAVVQSLESTHLLPEAQDLLFLATKQMNFSWIVQVLLVSIKAFTFCEDCFFQNIWSSTWGRGSFCIHCNRAWLSLHSCLSHWTVSLVFFHGCKSEYSSQSSFCPEQLICPRRAHYVQMWNPIEVQEEVPHPLFHLGNQLHQNP
ncbi:uncharacterized protein LOC141937834 [Strix uralensis]|uniref:uncharacterized protein LOC141937834 n=1 Tax=Strix uralensis TaxID=36305 RepID=UPI003DA76100